MKVLTALMTLEQHDGELVAAMEKHLPGVFFYSFIIHLSQCVCDCSDQISLFVY